MQVNRLVNLMFNFTGSLQRDAPAVSVRGEPCEPGSTLDVPSQAAMMAEQLVGAFQPVQDLIEKLPEQREPEVSGQAPTGFVSGRLQAGRAAWAAQCMSQPLLSHGCSQAWH